MAAPVRISPLPPNPSVADREKRRGTALHEAGHVLVLIALLGSEQIAVAKINSEEEVRSSGSLGFVERVVESTEGPTLEELLERGGEPLRRMLLRDSGWAAYVPVAAAYPKAVGRPLSGWQPGCSDMRAYESQAARLGHRRPAHVWDWDAWRNSQELVDRFWGTVSHIAEALYERGELNGAEIAGLIEEAPQLTNVRPLWR